MPEKIAQTAETDVLTVDRRLASRLAALALIVGFFLFLVGYFLGKKQAIQEFMSKIEQDSLADQVYASMHALYDVSDTMQVPNESTIAGQENAQGSCDLASQQENAQEMQSKETGKEYIAQIARFPRAKQARQLMQRLKKYGILATIKEQERSTMGGKKSAWYYVMTVPAAKKEELLKTIAKIKKHEPIKDIKIIDNEVQRA